MVSEADIDAFVKAAGWRETSRLPLAGDASGRRYLRLAGTRPAVLMVSASGTTMPFLQAGHWLREVGLSAPEVYASDDLTGLILMEDLGDALFARLITDDPACEPALFDAATDTLIAIARASPPNLPQMPPTYCELAATAWQWWGASDNGAEALSLLGTYLAELGEARVFIHRDWHAGNLLWLPDRASVARVGIIDFQDALLGHPGYDLVSMTRDARRAVPDALHHAMVARYAAALGLQHERFARDCALLGIQRNLRVLGIFARLALRDGKPGYLQFATIVWRHLMADLASPGLEALREQIIVTLPEPKPEFINV